MRLLLNLLARLTPGLTTNELIVIERYRRD